MLLVCDSGSTKADWLVAEGGRVIGGFETPGLNPFFHDRAAVAKVLQANPAARKYRNAGGRVYFFGAGCSSPARNKVIRDGLKDFFRQAHVAVEHDMLGAAIAACGDGKGVVCILGTGSNIAWFDGRKLSDTVHGLGYILGDEGSGSYFGKKLVTRYLYRRMPASLRRDFYRRYRVTKENAIEHVYRRPHANVYLASLARFLSEHKRHGWIRGLVYDGFREFFDTHIAAYPQHRKHPVHFIGSIAFHFGEELRRVGKESGFVTGRILVRPVDELMAWYLGKHPRA